MAPFGMQVQSGLISARMLQSIPFARTIPALLLIALTLLAAPGCDTQNQQEDFVAAASAPPAGYTQTNAGGEVLDEDEDDWRTAPVYTGRLRFDPAFPNPVSAGDFATVRVSVIDFDALLGGLVLRGRDPTGRLVEVSRIEDARDPGDYVFTFAPALLGRTGLQRLFVFDAVTGEIVSYGDLLVE
jgi:hypothetical protein